MSRVVYYTASSLDGFSADPQGDFSWGAPTEELHLAINDDVRDASVHLEGRRMYETMAVWETDPSLAEASPAGADFAAIWAGVDKIVFSRTLTEPWTARTRIERELTAEVVERARDEASGDLLIGGSTLACQALAMGLVDVIDVRVCPVLVGGGLPVFPSGVRLDLTLRRERNIPGGMVQLTYDVRR